jgi:hypothetical protein
VCRVCLSAQSSQWNKAEVKMQKLLKKVYRGSEGKKAHGSAQKEGVGGEMGIAAAYVESHLCDVEERDAAIFELIRNKVSDWGSVFVSQCMSERCLCQCQDIVAGGQRWIGSQSYSNAVSFSLFDIYCM